MISGSESFHFQPVILGAEGIELGPERVNFHRPSEVVVGVTKALFQVSVV